MEELLNSMGQDVQDSLLVVDSGSTDGTIEFFQERDVKVIISPIIKEEGYGPARNHLRQMAGEHLRDIAWVLYLDADERVDERDYHLLRVTKDTLSDRFDVIALPRVDWIDEARTAMAKDVEVFPDFQARLTRLDSSLRYVKALHEGIENCREIYADSSFMRINHFHRSAGADKRRRVGKLCSFLHMRDEELGNPEYPMHESEPMYRELVKKEGLD